MAVAGMGLYFAPKLSKAPFPPENDNNRPAGTGGAVSGLVLGDAVP
jgi:hypothetical protein